MAPNTTPHLNEALDYSREEGKESGRLTLNEEYDVGPPYGGDDSHYSPILLPNSDSGGPNKL